MISTKPRGWKVTTLSIRKDISPFLSFLVYLPNSIICFFIMYHYHWYWLSIIHNNNSSMWELLGMVCWRRYSSSSLASRYRYAFIMTPFLNNTKYNKRNDWSRPSISLFPNNIYLSISSLPYLARLYSAIKLKTACLRHIGKNYETNYKEMEGKFHIYVWMICIS